MERERVRGYEEIQVAQALPEGEPGGGGGSGFGFFLPLIALFLIMYAIIIRPQQRQQKQHREMVAAIERGDRVVTTGGIHGKVVGVSDDVLTVEIAERVRVRLNRTAVTTRTPAKSPAAKPGEAKS